MMEKKLKVIEDRLDAVLQQNYNLEKEVIALKKELARHISIGETCPHTLR